MVVLEQHGVVQAEPVQRAAAAANRVLFQKAHSGGGLAGVANHRRRPGDRLNVTAGERGDAAEPTDEIQHGALDREDRPQVAQKPPQDLTGSAGFAIAGNRLEPHITLEYFKQSRDDRQTGNGPGLPRHPRRSHITFVMDDALCGDIPGVGKVLRPGCAQKSIQRPIRGER